MEQDYVLVCLISATVTVQALAHLVELTPIAAPSHQRLLHVHSPMVWPATTMAHVVGLHLTNVLVKMGGSALTAPSRVVPPVMHGGTNPLLPTPLMHSQSAQTADCVTGLLENAHVKVGL